LLRAAFLMDALTAKMGLAWLASFAFLSVSKTSRL